MIDLNNTWCEATEENYRKLLETRWDSHTVGFAHTYDFYICHDEDKIKGVFITSKEYTQMLKTHKQIHIVDGEFQYVEEEVMEQNSFNKHGFETPDFEGEVLKKLNSRILIGYVINREGNYTAQKWSITGASQEGKYNLTPIKKSWYEEDFTPKAVKWRHTINSVFQGWRDDIVIKYEKNVLVTINGNHWTLEQLARGVIRPATKEEVLSLLIKE